MGVTSIFDGIYNKWTYYIVMAGEKNSGISVSNPTSNLIHRTIGYISGTRPDGTPWFQ